MAIRVTYQQLAEAVDNLGAQTGIPINLTSVYGYWELWVDGHREAAFRAGIDALEALAFASGVLSRSKASKE